MTRAATVLTVAAMLALSARPASAQDRAADEAALTRIKNEEWQRMYREQDDAALAAFLAADFVNIAPDGTVTPRAEELA